MKISEATFNIIPKDGKLPFSEYSDLHKYLLENDGIEQTITLKPSGVLSDKEKLYAFIYGPLMSCAIDGFTRAGYEGVDKVKARYLLEAELCKAETFTPKGGVKIYTESVSGMNNKRLLKFATDAMLFLEVELGQKTPDSEAWFMKLKSGKDYRAVK